MIGGKVDAGEVIDQFAAGSGKKAGEFYTPRCIVRVLVEVLVPYRTPSREDPNTGDESTRHASPVFTGRGKPSPA